MRGGADHMHQAWETMQAEQPGGDARCLTLAPRLTRAEMRVSTIQFLCPSARFLARGVKSDITSLGGVGKTRLALQMFAELSRGEPLFGCEVLLPERPMKCLYIGAEDKQSFFNNLALPILTHDDEVLPFDTILLPDSWPGFTLTPSTSRTLARFLADYEATHGLDIVALDPMLSLIGVDYSDMMKNPVVARAFFNDCVVPLLESQRFALLGLNHDSKAGAAVTGSADQQNASRCVLQLSTEGTGPDGGTVIAAERHKDNVGFRFTKLVLERDPNTLLLTWNPSTSVWAYGAPDSTASVRPADINDVRRYLARQAVRLLDPVLAPESRRAKRAVEDLLCARAADAKVKRVRETVRSFLEGCCEFESHKHGKTYRKLLVGVRNPDAGLDEHDDFLAGRAANEDDVTVAK